MRVTRFAESEWDYGSEAGRATDRATDWASERGGDTMIALLASFARSPHTAQNTTQQKRRVRGRDGRTDGWMCTTWGIQMSDPVGLPSEVNSSSMNGPPFSDHSVRNE